MAIAPSLGTEGVIFGTSYYSNLGGSELTLYDYANGNVTSPDFGAFLGTLPIPATITNVQGVAWKSPYLYFSSSNTLPGGNGGGIERVLYQNGVLSSQAELIWNQTSSVQGLGFDGSDILEATQPGGATTLSPPLPAASSPRSAAAPPPPGTATAAAPIRRPVVGSGNAQRRRGDRHIWHGATNAVTAAASASRSMRLLVGSLIFNSTNGRTIRWRATTSPLMQSR